MKQSKNSKIEISTSGYDSNKAIDIYKKEMAKHLKKFSSALEWSDFIGLLATLEEIIKEHNVKSNKEYLVEIPSLIKRLSQCLNPILPNGVHSKAVDVYETILLYCSDELFSLSMQNECLDNNIPEELTAVVINEMYNSKIFIDEYFNPVNTVIDTNIINYSPHNRFLVENFNLLFMPLFTFGSNVRILVMAQYIHLIKNRIVPLVLEEVDVKIVLRGLLPLLESESSDYFENVYGILMTIYGIYQFKYNRQKSIYYMLYSLFIEHEALRLPIFNFINKHKQNDMTFATIKDYEMLTKAYSLGLLSDSLFVIRNALDHTNSHFPLMINVEKEIIMKHEAPKPNEEDTNEEIIENSNYSTPNLNTIQFKKEYIITHEKNSLCTNDEIEAILHQFNNNLKCNVITILLKKENSLIKKVLKWFNNEEKSNFDEIISTMEIVLNDNTVPVKSRLDIFYRSINILNDRLIDTSDHYTFLSQIINRYYITSIKQLKVLVENEMNEKNIPFEELEGISALKAVKIFFNNGMEIISKMIFELLCTLLMKEPNIDEASNVIELLIFMLTIFTNVDSSFYKIHLFLFTIVIVKSRTTIKTELLHKYMNIFYKKIKDERLDIQFDQLTVDSLEFSIDEFYKQSNSLNTDEDYITKQLITILSNEIYNIQNYKLARKIINIVGVNNVYSEVIEINDAFNDDDLLFICKYHQVFGIPCYSNEFIQALEHYAKQDYTKRYIIENILFKIKPNFKSELSIILFQKYRENHDHTYIILYDMEDMLIKTLLNNNVNMDIINLLEYTASKELFIKAFVIYLCYLIEKNINSNIYYTLIQGIINPNKIILYLLHDLSASECNQDIIRIRILRDILTNINVIKIIRRGTNKLFGSDPLNIEMVINEVLSNKLQLNDKSFIKLCLNCYYILNINSINIKPIGVDIETIVTNYKSDMDIVKYTLHLLSIDYILFNLMEYYKMILKEINVKDIFNEAQKIEFYNKLINMGEEIIRINPNINHTFHIINIWKESYKYLYTSTFVRKIDLNLFYCKVMLYFISQTILKTEIQLKGRTLLFNQDFTKFNYASNDVVNISDDNTNLASDGYSIQISCKDDFKNIVDFNLIMFKNNPTQFVNALPNDLSVLPLFYNFNDQFKGRLFKEFYNRYNSYLLFMLYTDFDIIQMNRKYSQSLSEMDMLALLRLSMKSVDSVTMNTIINGMNLIFNENIFKMFYCVILNNMKYGKRFRDYLFLKLTKDKKIYNLICEVVLISNEIDEDRKQIEFKDVLIDMINHLYEYHKKSVTYHIHRKNLAILFTDSIIDNFFSDAFFSHSLLKKKLIFKTLGPYINYNQVLSSIFSNLETSFFSKNITQKIFNIRRLAFIFYTNSNYIETRWVDKILTCIYELINSKIELKIEIYKLLRILLFKVNERNINIIHPVIFEDMLLSIRLNNFKLNYAILSCIDISEFMELQEMIYEVVLDEFNKIYKNDTKTLNLSVEDNPKEYGPLFDYKANTMANLNEYACKALIYYEKNRKTLKRKSIKTLENLLLTQFEETEYK